MVITIAPIVSTLKLELVTGLANQRLLGHCEMCSGRFPAPLRSLISVGLSKYGAIRDGGFPPVSGSSRVAKRCSDLLSKGLVAGIVTDKRGQRGFQISL